VGLWRPAYRAPDARTSGDARTGRPLSQVNYLDRRQNLKSQAWLPTGTANAAQLAPRHPTPRRAGRGPIGGFSACLAGRQMRAHFTHMPEAAGSLRRRGTDQEEPVSQAWRPPGWRSCAWAVRRPVHCGQDVAAPTRPAPECAHFTMAVSFIPLSERRRSLLSRPSSFSGSLSSLRNI
jgi:hypothetical protein